MNRRENRKHMAEERPDIEAIRRFRTPAYEAEKLIRAQGEQISEDPAEHEAGKCWEEENKDNNTGSRN